MTKPTNQRPTVTTSPKFVIYAAPDLSDSYNVYRVGHYHKPVASYFVSRDAAKAWIARQS